MEDALILIAEATAMPDRIKAAIDLSFKHMIVDGNNKLVIQPIRGEVKIPWQIQTIIDDIRLFTESQVIIGFHHIVEGKNSMTNQIMPRLKNGPTIKCHVSR